MAHEAAVAQQKRAVAAPAKKRAETEAAMSSHLAGAAPKDRPPSASQLWPNRWCRSTAY